MRLKSHRRASGVAHQGTVVIPAQSSAALVADGHHARIDGWTSLAVLSGAIGVSLGFPLADPIVGAVITIAILGIVWQSMTAVFLRVLDGVAPKYPDEIARE